MSPSQIKKLEKTALLSEDRLAKENALAFLAGLSYGKWKAKQYVMEQKYRRKRKQ